MFVTRMYKNDTFLKTTGEALENKQFINCRAGLPSTMMTKIGLNSITEQPHSEDYKLLTYRRFSDFWHERNPGPKNAEAKIAEPLTHGIYSLCQMLEFVCVRKVLPHHYVKSTSHGRLISRVMSDSDLA
jgi:hypothetical protein